MPTKIGNVEAEFLTGAARFGDLLYTACTHQPLLKKEVPHSFFLSNDGGQWLDCGESGWKCVGMAIARKPAEKMVAVSEDGEVYTFVGGEGAAETIKPRPAALRGAHEIDGLVLAYGMRRQVWLRADEAAWQPMHAPDLKKGETGGFEAMCGASLDDLYAVGWRGEIWHFNGKSWSRKDSPTSVILTSCTLHKGQVFACGQNGTIVVGRDDQWSALPQVEFSQDLWAIHSFGDRLFAAAFDGLWELVDGALVPVGEANAIARTFHTLSSCEGVLWSVGGDDVLSFDGSQWARMT